jgi:hypothetical protein
VQWQQRHKLQRPHGISAYGALNQTWFLPMASQRHDDLIWLTQKW